MSAGRTIAVSAVTEPRDVGRRFSRDVGQLRRHTNRFTSDTDRLEPDVGQLRRHRHRFASDTDRLEPDVGRLRRATDRFASDTDRLEPDVGRFTRLEVSAWGAVIRLC
ncbi:hypothetical protein [Nonomuraea sp. NPDC048901]|uniref:hypothetical protein n=1 Tax=Nonomuraea sp. NPDC048901 TaxID=3155627 RepID=UPI0033F630ED